MSPLRAYIKRQRNKKKAELHAQSTVESPFSLGEHIFIPFGTRYKEVSPRLMTNQEPLHYPRRKSDELIRAVYGSPLDPNGQILLVNRFGMPCYVPVTEKLLRMNDKIVSESHYDPVL